MPGKAAKGSTPRERSAAARARLLAAASELFYAEGVQSVGIDRVIEHAGVAKATLYSAFGSKEELVRAYLRARHAATMQRMSDELEARYPTARERLIGVFEVQGLSFTDPGFRGCAFVGAKAEARPGGAVDEVADEYRGWLHGLFAGLAQEAGATDPKGLARQLVLLYDGAGISAWLDRDPSAENAARAVAAALVSAAIPDAAGR
jgi:AcrR family transcriptional regulator